MTQAETVYAPEHIRSLKPYVPGKPIDETAREFGLAEDSIIKLASNENPLGMPPSSVAAMDAATKSGARYPDPSGHSLKAAIASRYSVKPDWLTLGNGSSDILELVARAFLQGATSEKDCNAVSSQYAFIAWSTAVKSIGARVNLIPALNYGHDLEAMISAVTPQTRVVYLANPNNPTGTCFSLKELEGALERIPGTVVVLLDEAYNEYMKPEMRYDSVKLVEKYPNLVVSRTFSKAFGLAGLRIGYAIAQPFITDLLNRVRQTFNVNSFAQVAAIAALSDTEYLEKSYALNREGLSLFYGELEAMGLTFIQSQGNFVMVQVPNAATIYKKLLERGFIVRPVSNYGLSDWLRISIGLPEENLKFFSAFKAVLATNG